MGWQFIGYSMLMTSEPNSSQVNRQTAYINGRILQEQEFCDGLVVIVHGSTIKSVTTADEVTLDEYDIIDLDGNYMLPGFIDVQVNGGGGVLFNESPDFQR